MTSESKPATEARKKPPVFVILLGLALHPALRGQGRHGRQCRYRVRATRRSAFRSDWPRHDHLLHHLYTGYSEATQFSPMVERMRGLIDQKTLVAVPLFIMSGSVMARGEISTRLIDFARACVGWIPGGLGMSAVFACVFFAAISGSVVLPPSSRSAR